MSALIDTQTREFCAQLLGAMACRQAGEPSPQRLHFRRPVEPEQPAKGGGVALLEMLGPLDPQQRHEEECQHAEKKREVIEELLKENPERSNRQIAASKTTNPSFD